MMTKEVKDCKKCGGKGHLKNEKNQFLACDNCCTHEGPPLTDPRNPEKLLCNQGCGKEVKVEVPTKLGAKVEKTGSNESAKDRKNRLAREARAAKKK